MFLGVTLALIAMLVLANLLSFSSYNHLELWDTSLKVLISLKAHENNNFVVVKDG